MAKSNKSNRLLYILLAAVVIVLVIAVIGKKQGWIGNKKAVEVEFARAEKLSIIEKVSASGMIQPVTEVKLSPDVPGEIIELNIEEGDSVQAGQLLVKIKPDNFVSALERAEATLNQQKANYHSSLAALENAKSALTNAESIYKRQKQLWDERVISEADWQQAEQNYQVAINDLKSSEQTVKAAQYIVKSGEASVREARENVRLTNVMAPMSGIVSKLDVEKGERVVGTQQMAGTEMLRIADLNKMEVRVNVNENDIIRVSLGDTAVIDVDSYTYMDKTFKGVVTQIANTANDKVSSDAVTEFEVRIKILNESYQDLVEEGRKYPFRPGMTASVDILTDKKDNVLAIPLGAVTTRSPDDKQKEGEETNGDEESTQVKKVNNKKDEEIEVVFINNNGIAKMIPVETGISDYDNIEILSGISDTTQVVTGPFLIVSKRLKDGDPVKEVEEKDEEKDN